MADSLETKGKSDGSLPASSFASKISPTWSRLLAMIGLAKAMYSKSLVGEPMNLPSCLMWGETNASDAAKYRGASV